MRKPFSFYLAHWIGKLALFGMRLLRRTGSYLPGAIALRIDPDYLSHTGKPEHIVMVTGTNGKTSVCNMLRYFIESAGQHVMDNREGSNTIEGLASAFLTHNTWSGKSPHESGVLELDERSAIRVFPHVQPDVLLVTNLYRDSYQRNAHAEYIYNILDRSIPPTTKLVLNAEDPISGRLALKNKRVYYGIPILEGEREQRNSRFSDLVYCPVCHRDLEIEFIRYNHIGRYHCKYCGYRSPEAQCRVISFDRDRKEAQCAAGEERALFYTQTDGVTDLYNLLSAAATAVECGVPFSIVAESSKTLPPLRSRHHEEIIRGRRFLSILCKGYNPVAPARVFEYLQTQPGRKVLVMANGTEEEIVENMAYLYDNDYSYLNDPSFFQIFCCGERYLDYALRLRMAGIPEDRIVLSREYDEIPRLIAYEEADLICLIHDVSDVPWVRNLLSAIRKDMAQLQDKE